MLLHIYDHLLVSDLQEKFAECFPCLKIEFYSKPHHHGEKSTDENRIDPSRKIGNIRHTHNEGLLEIRSRYSTAHVERDFRKLFGLNVQVFRNEKFGWVQTSETDKYTLQQQNDMVSHVAEQIRPKYKEQFGEHEDL